MPLVTFRQPLAISLKTEYFSKGSWKQGTLNFAHFDICEEVKRKDRPWSNMYDPFQKCPPTKDVGYFFIYW